MLRWPWRRPAERRSVDALLAQLVAQRAAGDGVSVEAGAALETAATWYESAFAAAEWEGGSRARLFGPAELAAVARAIVRDGEAVWIADVSAAGELAVLPAASWDVSGGPSPASWTWRVALAGPSGQVDRVLPMEAVMHFRRRVGRASPWRGRSGADWASESARLAAGIERSLADEAATSTGAVLPVPVAPGEGDDEEPDVLAGIKSDLAALRGRLAFVETVAAGWGEGAAAAPRKDWQPVRLGPNVPESSVALHERSATAILSALGLPAPLVEPRADGTARREAYRQWLHAGVQPMARVVEAEVRRVLEDPEARLSFRSLAAADVAARARAMKALLDADVAESEARVIAGVD